MIRITKTQAIQFFLILVISVLSPLLVSQKLTDPRVIAIGLALVLSAYSIYMLRTAFVFLVALALYGLIGITYGYPNMAMFVSFIETNASEAKGFFSNTPIINWVGSVIFLVASASYYYITKKQVKTIGYKWRIFIWFWFIVFLTASFEGRLINTYYNKIASYFTHKKMMNESLSKTPTWSIEKTNHHSKYKNYILIIGESARADYMSVFGYKHNTTSFLSGHNGVYFSRAYSPAANTVASLTRSLQVYNPDADTFAPENNIITLANHAGYETYWISNAGRVGTYDSAVSALSVRANHRDFLNRGGFKDTTQDDLSMLNNLQHFLKEPSAKPRLIVLHMTGSHPSTCKAMFGTPVTFNVSENKEVNCYLGTIKKLDTFIEQTLKVLNDQSYSMLYFSDHGISVRHDGVRHAFDVRNNYHVPMLMINSDSTEQVFIDTVFSNMNFMRLFQSWVGVRDSKASSEKYDVFALEALPEPQTVKVFDGDQLVNMNGISPEAIIE